MGLMAMNGPHLWLRNTLKMLSQDNVAVNSEVEKNIPPFTYM